MLILTCQFWQILSSVMVAAVSSSAFQVLFNIHVALYQLLESFLRQAMEVWGKMDLVELYRALQLMK